MGLTGWRTLGSTALVAAAASWVVVDLGTGHWFDHVQVPWTVPLALAAIAALILVAAWPVRQYVKGKRERIDRLRAATVLALAKACSLTGAALTGVYLGIGLVALRTTGSALLRERVWQAGVATLAALALALAGRLAESFCRLPPEDKGLEEAGSTRPGPAPA
ncbi:MAG: DUF3180 domain-containing protein [Bifidobacteriaceae bacterium]|jgi:hypothetical protein|nr:DUF3180 domain-containing protein [Bifidobacteriaceae bacterium]